ncbi:hypothetical protein LJD48_28160, partial [Escherichia coli]|nr:hypothetical protein [Escherichia coli]
APPYGAPQNNPQNSAWPQQPGGPQGGYGPNGPQGPGGPFAPAGGQPKSNAKLWIFVSGAVVVLALIALLIWLLMGLLKGNDSAANTGTTA